MNTNSTRRGFAEVRMQGFSSRATVDQARAWLDSQTSALPAESIALDDLAGRVLAQNVVSEVNVPAFARAMMDGFAVVAADTSGASVYNQVLLTVVGEVLPGQAFPGRVSPGQAVRIMTGAPVPLGADSVLPVETVHLEGGRILALDEVTPGKHVGRVGEDIATGTTVLHAGRRLRPQDLGVLSSIGLPSAPVVQRPRVRILVTGNELLPAGSRPACNQTVDANGPMLAALVHRDGGISCDRRIIPDDPAILLDAMRGDADVVLISGGSSVGQEDHVPNVLAEHGRLVLHGIAMRPSSPAGMGVLDNRLVFLLPGNPVSCLCAYDFFAGRAIRTLAGLPPDWQYRCVRLPLARKLVSVAGRVDYARVKIEGGRVEPLAISSASVLTSTTRADGFVIVPHDSEGYPPGTNVDVWLYG